MIIIIGNKEIAGAAVLLEGGFPGFLLGPLESTQGKNSRTFPYAALAQFESISHGEPSIYLPASYFGLHHGSTRNEGQ